MGPISMEKRKFIFKIGFHDTIHTFKNYFAIVFSVFSNKRYPNRLYISIQKIDFNHCSSPWPKLQPQPHQWVEEGVCFSNSSNFHYKVNNINIVTSQLKYCPLWEIYIINLVGSQFVTQTQKNWVISPMNPIQ